MPFVAVRVLALLFALSWLIIPGFGLIDLSVTWSPDWPVMLEAGWGLFFSVFVGLAFLVVALFPKRSGGAAVVQLYVATVALTVAAVVSLEWPALVLAAAVAVETAALTRAREAEALRPLVTAPSRSLLLLAAAAAPPWFAYGWNMSSLNRQELPTERHHRLRRPLLRAGRDRPCDGRADFARRPLATWPATPRDLCRCCRPLPGDRVIRVAEHAGWIRPDLVRLRRCLGCLLHCPRVDASTRTAQLGAVGGHVRHSLNRVTKESPTLSPGTSRDLRSVAADSACSCPVRDRLADMPARLLSVVDGVTQQHVL